VKEIYLQFFESTAIGESYKELLQIKFFLSKEKESDKKKISFYAKIERHPIIGSFRSNL